MRIGGLASGMDTDQIIRDLMNAKKIPLTKVTQKKQALEWKLDSYRDINRKLDTFSNSLDKMTMSGSFTKKKMDITAPNDVSIVNKNSTTDFTGTINIQKLAKNSTMQSDVIAGGAGKPDTTTLADLGINGTTITVNAINDKGVMEAKDVTVASTDTLKQVMAKITKETGVNAFYDAKTGQIALSTKNGGANADGSSEIAITSNGNIAASLGLAGKQVATTGKGQNAEYSVNGLQMTSTTNTVTVNGFEFTLKAANGTDIDFSSKPDTDAIYDNIVSFVDDYNKLMGELNSLTSEKKNRDFQPLTAEQKAEMSEKEIELWEAKAKSGLLKNDQMVSSMVTKMRSALMGAVEGQGSLKDIGIGGAAYGKYAYQSDGMLVIDEQKLKAAIDEDPNKVHQMFSQGATTAAGGKPEEQGMAIRLKEIANGTIKQLNERAGKEGAGNSTFSLGRSLDDMNKQMDRLEVRLKMVEARYWKQFGAMENAIQRANAQSAQLMNAFGGGA